MNFIPDELSVLFDVDDTLVMWPPDITKQQPGSIEFLPPGFKNYVYLMPHYKHIELIRCYHHRNYHITVWSNGGATWAKQVVEKLGLEKYVNQVMTKPVKLVDDQKLTKMLPSPVYLKQRYTPERWNPILGYEEFYEISTSGRIKDKATKRIINIQVSPGGYPSVGLNKNGKTKIFLVHRLVALNFLPNPNNKKVIHHVDSNRRNNTIDNLRWASHKENNEASLVNGRQVLKGTQKRNAKLTDEKALKIYELVKSGTMTKKEIAKQFNVHRQTIHNISIKKDWKHIHEDIED